jgi:RND family efflux transporter MFP subunit
VLLVTLALLTACNDDSSRGPTATPVATSAAISPPTYTVVRGDAVRTIDFTGRVSPVIEEELFFRTSGYVESIFVERDDEVDEGELLAELEVTDLKNQLAQAEAGLQAAQDSSEQRIAEAQAGLAVAELRLSITRANDPELQVIVAEVGLERAQTNLATAQEDHQEAVDRIWEPDEVRDAAARRLRDAELNLRVAEAQYQQALNSRLVYYYNIQIDEKQVELSRLQLEQLETGLAVQEMELLVQRLRDQLDDARLTAPFDGLVRLVSVNAGRAVDAYRNVMTVAQLDELEVSAGLTPQQLQDLTEGMEEVTCAPLNAPGQETAGTVRRLPYPYGTGGRTGEAEDVDVSARISLDTDASGVELTTGALMRCVVEVDRADDVLCLPPEAIRIFEGRRFVLVREEEGDRRVDVRIGIESEDCWEIEQGLDEGQIVVGQ